MHNANILFMLIEFLLNDLPISFWHFPFVLTYGLIYVVFSWVLYHYRGYHYYFFLDYTKPYALYWYLGLFIVVLFFFVLSYGVSYALNYYSDSMLPSVVSAWSVCGLLTHSVVDSLLLVVIASTVGVILIDRSLYEDQQMTASMKICYANVMSWVRNAF